MVLIQLFYCSSYVTSTRHLILKSSVVAILTHKQETILKFQCIYMINGNIQKLAKVQPNTYVTAWSLARLNVSNSSK